MLALHSLVAAWLGQYGVDLPRAERSRKQPENFKEQLAWRTGRVTADFIAAAHVARPPLRSDAVQD
jgi:hypothetical protein